MTIKSQESQIEKDINRAKVGRRQHLELRKQKFIDSLCDYLWQRIYQNRAKYQSLILKAAQEYDKYPNGFFINVWSREYFLAFMSEPSFLYYEEYADDWLIDGLKVFANKYSKTVKELIYSKVQIRALRIYGQIVIDLFVDFNKNNSNNDKSKK